MSDTSHIYRALTEPLPVHRDGQVIAHPSERAVVHTREQIDLGHKHPELIAALLGAAPEPTDDDEPDDDLPAAA